MENFDTARYGDFLDVDGRIDGRYVPLKTLGSGGFGSVFLVKDTLDEDEPRKALKVIHRHLLDDAEVARRFRNEILLQRKLVHPGIPRAFNDGVLATGAKYFTMEYFEATTLADLLADQPRLTIGRALGITLQILEIVRYAHERGVVHRDLKPANVLLVPDGSIRERIVLIDFGISKALTSSSTSNVIPSTKDDRRPGTAAYMSPEQAREDWTSARAKSNVFWMPTDYYALGVILYRMVLGRLPWDRRDPHWSIRRSSFIPRAPEPGEVPPWLEQLLFGLLNEVRARRLSGEEALLRMKEGPRFFIDEDDHHEESRRPWTTRLVVAGATALTLAVAVAVGVVVVPGLLAKSEPETDAVHARNDSALAVGDVDEVTVGAASVLDPETVVDEADDEVPVRDPLVERAQVLHERLDRSTSSIESRLAKAHGGIEHELLAILARELETSGWSNDPAAAVDASRLLLLERNADVAESLAATLYARWRAIDDVSESASTVLATLGRSVESEADGGWLLAERPLPTATLDWTTLLERMESKRSLVELVQRVGSRLDLLGEVWSRTGRWDANVVLGATLVASAREGWSSGRARVQQQLADLIAAIFDAQGFDDFAKSHAELDDSLTSWIDRCEGEASARPRILAAASGVKSLIDQSATEPIVVAPDSAPVDADDALQSLLVAPWSEWESPGRLSSELEALAVAVNTPREFVEPESVTATPPRRAIEPYEVCSLQDVVAREGGAIEDGSLLSALEIQLVLIPAGDFERRLPADFSDGGIRVARDEKGPFSVTVDESFFIARFETTRRVWQQVMDLEPSESLDDYPVAMVTWEDAVRFCQHVQDEIDLANEGATEPAWRVRLPTWAEWEWACRAGSSAVYGFGAGSDALSEHAVVDAERAAPVGSTAPNAWGLYDMQGNLSEWCGDLVRFEAGRRHVRPNHDADLPRNADRFPDRIVVGGDYARHAAWAACSLAHHEPADSAHPNIGFRIVVTRRP